MDRLPLELISKIQEYVFDKDWLNFILANKNILSAATESSICEKKKVFENASNVWKGGKSFAHTLVIGGSACGKTTTISKIVKVVRSETPKVYYLTSLKQQYVPYCILQSSDFNQILSEVGTVMLYSFIGNLSSKISSESTIVVLDDLDDSMTDFSKSQVFQTALDGKKIQFIVSLQYINHSLFSRGNFTRLIQDGRNPLADLKVYYFLFGKDFDKNEYLKFAKICSATRNWMVCEDGKLKFINPVK